MKPEMPNYILNMLEQHRNTVVSKKKISEFGGDSAFLEALSSLGYECSLREPDKNMIYRAQGVCAHKIIEVKGYEMYSHITEKG